MILRSNRQKCYCAFCKSERVVYVKRRVNLFNFAASAAASILVMSAIWQHFDPRVMLFFVAFLALGETFVQIRWRLNIVCKHCGFDPVLYLKDANKAALKVKDFLDKRKADPSSLLKPALNIPTIKKSQLQAIVQTEAISKGRLVSKEI